MSDCNRVQGTVKCFFTDKGYGFVTPNDGGKDIFVHHKSITGEGFKSLEEGQSVEVVTEMGKKGLQAKVCVPM